MGELLGRLGDLLLKPHARQELLRRQRLPLTIGHEVVRMGSAMMSPIPSTSAVASVSVLRPIIADPPIGLPSTLVRAI